jgi:hypothetical protein
MKSLYESILDDEDVLIQDTIVSSNKHFIGMWCEKHNVFDGKFMVNDNYEIERTDKNNPLCILYLDFNDYTELPEYIKFADDEDLIVKLGIQKNDRHGYKVGKIESFRGIPNKMHALIINTNLTHLPDLEVSCPKVTFNTPWVKKYGKIIIHDNKEYIRFNNTVYGLTEIPKSIRAEGTKALILTNCADFGDNFSKLLNRKAPMNKYKNKFEFPVTDEGIENIKKFLSKSIDIKDLWEIQYTQNSKIVKYRNNWYRTKNW